MLRIDGQVAVATDVAKRMPKGTLRNKPYLEATSLIDDDEANIVFCEPDSLLSAVHLAFTEHYPLIISPDTVLLTVS